MKFKRWMKLPFGGKPLTGYRCIFAWCPVYVGHYEWAWLCRVLRRRIGLMTRVHPVDRHDGFVISQRAYTYEYTKVCV